MRKYFFLCNALCSRQGGKVGTESSRFCTNRQFRIGMDKLTTMLQRKAPSVLGVFKERKLDFNLNLGMRFAVEK